MCLVLSSHPFKSSFIFQRRKRSKVHELGDLWSLMEGSVNIWHHSHATACCHRAGQCTEEIHTGIHALLVEAVWLIIMMSHHPHITSKLTVCLTACLASKLYITVLPWGKSTSHQWTPIIKVYSSNGDSVSMPCHHHVQSLKWVAYIPIHHFIARVR